MRNKFYKKLSAYQAWKKFKFRLAQSRFSGDDQLRAAFYRQFLSPGDICFDVGANMGNRSKIFLHLGARVIAFEPQSLCADFLEAGFGHQNNFYLERKALGATRGTAEMMVSAEHTISSLSPQWLQAVQESGRFAQYSWDQCQQVEMTTMDEMIARYGVPKFVKIDVEGYEQEVVSGLTQPVGALSLEFTPEYIETTVASIRHLASLGDLRLNYSLGETMKWALPDWCGVDEMIDLLLSLREQTALFGDVYVRFSD